MKNQRRARAKRVRAAGGVRGFWTRKIRQATNPFWQAQYPGDTASVDLEAALVDAYARCVRG